MYKPADGAVVETARPKFRVRPVPGSDHTVVQVCADLACARKLATLSTTTGEATSDADLPPGHVYWWSWSENATGRVGHETELRTLNVETRLEVDGKVVSVIAPSNERPFAADMVAVGERALELYAQLLGQPVPRTHLPIYFYSTDAGFTAAGDYYGNGETKTFGGFTNKWGSQVRFQKGSHRRPGEPVPDEIYLVALHELAHAFSQETMVVFPVLPAWIVEGTATFLAERARHDDTPARESALVERRWPRAAGPGRHPLFIPWDELFDVERSDQHAKTDDRPWTAAFYAETYSILDFLDSPANPERHARLRKFLRDVGGMGGFFVTLRIKGMFRDAFGPIEPLEQEWRAWLERRAAKPRPK